MKKLVIIQGALPFHPIFNTNHNNTVVNKKGETAKLAIERDLTEVKRESKTKPGEMEVCIFNKRVERKMKQYGSAVCDFIKDKDIYFS